MQIFNFNGANVRTVTLAGGEPGFVGKDVAERLGYVDTSDAIKRHCRGSVIRLPIPDALGRMQQVRVLTEPDVMRLIVSSKLPEAEAFERWVFEDVLPSLRKTGAYSNPNTVPQAVPASVEALMVAEVAARMLRLEGSAALGMARKATELTAPHLLPMLPVYAIDAPSGSGAVGSESTDSISALMKANDIKGTAATMNVRLEMHGFLEKKTLAGQSGEKSFWSVTEAGQKYGKNLTSPQNQRETQPHWYRDKFLDLMSTINAK